MRQTFGKTIIELASKYKDVVLLTGDVEQEMREFKYKFPDRFFNLGICEQSITSISGGMAMNNLRPVVYSITPFVLERPYEQIKLDIDEHNLPVILIGYSDYPTHGVTHRTRNPEDIAKTFKNFNIFSPHTKKEASKSIFDAYLMGEPAIIFLKKDCND